MIVKIICQLDDSSKLKLINAPNTTIIDRIGRIELYPSIFPLFCALPLSVSHALNAASLALDPKNVIKQSNRIAI